MRNRVGSGEYLGHKFELWKEQSIYTASIPDLELYFIGGFGDLSRCHLHALHKIHCYANEPDFDDIEAMQLLDDA